MNVSKGLQTAAVIAVLGAAFYVFGWCQYKKGAAEAILQQAGDTTDARVARLAADQEEREAAWRRVENRQNREIVIFRNRADSLQRVLASRVIVVAGDSLLPKPAVDSLIAAKDAVIRADSSGMVARDGRIAELLGSVRYLMDTTVVDLQRQRDTWKVKAERPRYTVTDVGGAALVGYGVSEKNETLVLVGVATVVLPRVLHGVGHILGRIF